MFVIGGSLMTLHVGYWFQELPNLILVWDDANNKAITTKDRSNAFMGLT